MSVSEGAVVVQPFGLLLSHAWLSLMVKAIQLNKLLYQVKADPLRDDRRAELKKSRAPALQPA